MRDVMLWCGGAYVGVHACVGKGDLPPPSGDDHGSGHFLVGCTKLSGLLDKAGQGLSRPDDNFFCLAPVQTGNTGYYYYSLQCTLTYSLLSTVQYTSDEL